MDLERVARLERESDPLVPRRRPTDLQALVAGTAPARRGAVPRTEPVGEGREPLPGRALRHGEERPRLADGVARVYGVDDGALGPGGAF